nr:uncharacterized protein LOC110004526 [Labrus bergylta]
MTSRNLEPNCVWDPIRNQIIRFCPTDFRARPRPSDGLDELLYIDIDKMYQWAEDDGDLPLGVGRLDLSEPVSGRRYVMYHGTTSQAARSIMATGFQQSAGGMLGPGVYLSRVLDKASRYPIKHPEHDRVVIKVVVNVGRVIAINYQGHPRQKTWHDYRYGEVFDTAWVPPRCGMVSSGLEEDCVWDPNRIQIISAIKPRPMQPSAGYGAYGYMLQVNINEMTHYSFHMLQSLETRGHQTSDLTACTTGESRRENSDSNPDIIMQWAENDFDLPPGVVRLGLSAPVNGKKYVMYHGTTSQAARSIMAKGFQQSSGGMLGPGVYLSRDLNKASRYPIDHPEHDRVVIKVVVNVGRVIAINRQGHPRQKTWHDSRYGEVFDTAWVPPNCGMVPSGLEEDCVWDPSRIKINGAIKPSAPAQGGWGARGYMKSEREVVEELSESDTDTSMPYQWAEDDGGLPYGVTQLGLSQPVSGKRYVMYHGTTRQAAQSIQATGFGRSTDGMLGPGVYLSRDLDKASRYPIGHPEYDRVVIKVVVNVGKVIAINRQGHPRQKTWHDSRYGEVFDTAWVPPRCGMVSSGSEENCVWDPSRIQIIKIIQPMQTSNTSIEGAGLAAVATAGIFGAAAALLFAALGKN